jgi:peroxiredoxin
MPETITTPAVGSRIPDFDLLDPDGASSPLSDRIAGRPAVLFFMRAADCPVCLAHARTLGGMAASGALDGVSVLVIAPGGSAAARTARSRIASPRIEVRASGDHHSDVGLGRFLGLQHSGTFVVDADGRILSAQTSGLPTASFSRAKVLVALGR